MADVMILTHSLTEFAEDDAVVGVHITKECPACPASVTADAAYDTRPSYRASAMPRSEVFVPGQKNPITKRGLCKARDRTVR